MLDALNHLFSHSGSFEGESQLSFELFDGVLKLEELDVLFGYKLIDVVLIVGSNDILIFLCFLVLLLNFKFFYLKKRSQKKLGILEKKKGISTVDIKPNLISNKKSVAIVCDKCKIFDAAA